MFGLKLLSAIIERNPRGMIPLIKTLIPTLSSYYELNHPRLNRHTIKLIKSLVENKEISFKDMLSLKILENTQTMISSMLKNRQEWSLELMLYILHDILSQLNDTVKNKQEMSIVQHIDEIFNNFESCVQLLSLQFDVQIVEKASQCLIQML